jgi:CHAP domain
MNVFAQVLERWRVIKADRGFAPVEPPNPPAIVGPAPRPLHYDDPFNRDLLARKALTVALGELERGCGEFGGNNCGPDVERYIAPGKPPASWCAGFVGWCYAEAARELGVALPFRRSLGAKALGKAIAAAGRRFSDPAQAQPGDVMILDRGAQGSWMGHATIVERVAGGAVHTVEGNSGPKVRRRVHPVPVARLAFLASVRRGT